MALMRCHLSDMSVYPRRDDYAVAWRAAHLRLSISLISPLVAGCFSNSPSSRYAEDRRRNDDARPAGWLTPTARRFRISPLTSTVATSRLQCYQLIGPLRRADAFRRLALVYQSASSHLQHAASSARHICPFRATMMISLAFAVGSALIPLS